MSGIIGTGGKSGVIGAGSREGWILLEKIEATSGGQQQIGTSSNITTRYLKYMLVASSIHVSVASQIRFQFYINGSRDQNGYDTASSGKNSNAQALSVESVNYAYCFLASGVDQDTHAAHTQNFIMHFSNPTDTSLSHVVWGSGAYITSGGHTMPYTFAFKNDSIGALTSLFVYTGSGTLTGNFKLYGLSR